MGQALNVTGRSFSCALFAANTAVSGAKLDAKNFTVLIVAGQLFTGFVMDLLRHIHVRYRPSRQARLIGKTHNLDGAICLQPGSGDVSE
ncbi:DMT family transporter [Lelliottia amnigena]|uniref:DMT family transporter n=1 Tax=Lelliottia amnigena TaxID=61646 RepID=UPI0037BF5D5B